MVLEAIFSLLFSIVDPLLSMLPDIAIDIDNNVFINLCNILRLIAYFVPMNTVASILTIIVSIMMFKVIISLLKTLWQIIPLL